MQKVAFLDRDGIVNIDHGYVSVKDDFEFHPDIVNVCRFLHQQGFTLVVVTNQSGIGRGYYDEDAFWDLTEWMVDTLSQHGVFISGVYFCPHHPDNALGDYLMDCNCRKPKPGMFLQAQEHMDIDLSESIMIGDKSSDVWAADAAGIRRHFLVSSQYEFDKSNLPENCTILDKLIDVTQAL